jgi:hypothetical protein
MIRQKLGVVPQTKHGLTLVLPTEISFDFGRANGFTSTGGISECSFQFSKGRPKLCILYHNSYQLAITGGRLQIKNV